MCGALKNTEVSARWGFLNVGSRGDVQGIEESLSQVESFLKRHASYRGCRSKLRKQLQFRTGEQRFPPYGAEDRQVDVGNMVKGYQMGFVASAVNGLFLGRRYSANHL